MESWCGRLKVLATGAEERRGGFVLYWMQAALRAEDNPALDYAIELANRAESPLVVLVTLIPNYPDANRRHFHFFLEGVEDAWERLTKLGAHPVFRVGEPLETVSDFARDAQAVVLDRGYLRHQKQWYRALTSRCREIAVPLYQVEGEAIVALETVSSGAEYAARTIRPKLRRHLPSVLSECSFLALKVSSPLPDIDRGPAVQEIGRAYLRDSWGGPTPVSELARGGSSEAQRRLRRFLDGTIGRYATGRNHPHLGCTSTLSPYLHFGMISPRRIALEVRETLGTDDPNRESFLEELLVRRSLSQNYCLFNEAYDEYGALPQWARTTLAEHRDDARPFCYRFEQFEEAQTHDPYWNAAQIEMVETGYMHNYMRMYWGKKILEWSGDPEEAFQTALTLNNRYLLDGRDPASFANVGWLFGLHDRPWPERPIYGKVRCMMASGLERKTDPEAYVRGVAERTGRKVPGERSRA